VLMGFCPHVGYYLETDLLRSNYITSQVCAINQILSWMKPGNKEQHDDAKAKFF
jgi:hypothetical protein